MKPHCIPPTSFAQYEQLAGSFMRGQEAYYRQRQDASRAVLYRLLQTYLAPLEDKKILDAGCGFGKDIAYLVEQGAIPYGVDAAEQMVAQARQQNPTATIDVQQLGKTTFPNNLFDGILSRYAIQHDKDLQPIFADFYRILKPGGIAAIVAAHPLWGFSLKQQGDYFVQETVTVPLFENTVTVSEPTHTFSEYLNDFVLRHFSLLAFEEGRSEATESRLTDTVPHFFAVALQKRG